MKEQKLNGPIVPGDYPDKPPPGITPKLAPLPETATIDPITYPDSPEITQHNWRPRVFDTMVIPQLPEKPDA